MNNYEKAYQDTKNWLDSLNPDEANDYFDNLRKKFDHMVDSDPGITYAYLDDESDWLDPDAVSPEAAQS